MGASFAGDECIHLDKNVPFENTGNYAPNVISVSIHKWVVKQQTQTKVFGNGYNLSHD